MGDSPNSDPFQLGRFIVARNGDAVRKLHRLAPLSPSESPFRPVLDCLCADTIGPGTIDMFAAHPQ
jgi:hypothetical protein